MRQGGQQQGCVTYENAYYACQLLLAQVQLTDVVEFGQCY